MKPDTTLVFTYLSLGHFCMTSRCRLAQIYLYIVRGEYIAEEEVRIVT